MVSTEQGAYTFVPWFRQGVGAGIDQVDDPVMANPGSATPGRATLPAVLTLTATPLQGTTPVHRVIHQPVQLVGPGDIGTLKTSAILRVFPPSDARDATPSELAFVEFYDEDLPWRYTPAKPASVTVGSAARPQLRPWIALFVLAQGEFTVQPRADGPPKLVITANTPLPPNTEAWAWAHAQLAGGGQTPETAGPSVAADPDAALSRLMSPRKLLSGTQYTAFIVPAFEAGRLAGLGEDIATVPMMQPSWTPGGGAQIEFPIYFAWQFTTGTEGTFESYVRKLESRRAGAGFGHRTVAADLSTYGLVGPATFEIEGALQPPEFARTAFADVPPVPGLVGLLDDAVARLLPGGTAGDDPGIVPPVYGRWPAGVAQLGPVDPQGDVGWIREVNLDLRGRASAGLGAQIVRDNQDELIARAWAQVGSLHDVNQKLREAELAVAASSALFGKHFVPATPDDLFLLSAATHHGIPAETTTAPASGAARPSLRAAVRISPVPSSIEDGAFKRATRPVVPLLRDATGTTVVGGFRTALVANLNDQVVSAAPPVPAPADSVPLATVAAVVSTAASSIVHVENEPGRVFWQMLVAALTSPPSPSPLVTAPAAGDLKRWADDKFAAWQAADPTASATTVNGVTALLGTVPAATVVLGVDGTVTMTIDGAEFQTAYGKKIAGKGGRGVTIMCAGTAETQIARFADDDGATDYGTSVTAMTQGIAARSAGVSQPPVQFSGLLGALHPVDTVGGRVTAALPGFADGAAERAAAGKRRLQPVMGYPMFRDHMFTALQAIDREYILPNLGDLPENTLTLMTPNGRFLESFFAGLNTQMARELLWQEYPTDQRGSYFRVFWARDDAIGAHDVPDVEEMPEWSDDLGGNGSAADQPLVLVVRSELLRKFPNTLVYAQPAKFTAGGRTLDLDAAPVYPSFHATLDPDVFLIGFGFGEATARGTATDPGLYFVFAERPGQVRFGLDDTPAGSPLATWDDLSWAALSGSSTYLEITPNSPAPTTPSPGVWAATSADMAAILFRSPTMYARHAANMLPPVMPTPPPGSPA